jgi:hypothetical protein
MTRLALAALAAVALAVPASASAGVASVFSIRAEPALGCWPWSSARLAPGFYVAHKTLRCGTRVRVCYRGRCVRATVRDRGPYVPGREWDLDVRVQRALRFPYGIAALRATVLR